MGDPCKICPHGREDRRVAGKIFKRKASGLYRKPLPMGPVAKPHGSFRKGESATDFLGFSGRLAPRNSFEPLPKGLEESFPKSRTPFSRSLPWVQR